MKLLFKSFLFLFLIVPIGAVFVLGKTGIVPGVSKITGANKPRDLGVAYSEMNLESANVRTKISREALPANLSPKESIKYSGVAEISSSLTGEELTATANKRAELWHYFPVKSLQVRINEDGTAEISATTSVGRIIGYLSTIGVATGEVEQALKKIIPFKTEFPVYLKGAVSVADNKVDLNLQKAEVGRLTIPQSLIDQNKDKITWLIEKRLNDVPNCKIKSLTLKDRRLYFDGTLPSLEQTSP